MSLTKIIYLFIAKYRYYSIIQSRGADNTLTNRIHWWYRLWWLSGSSGNRWDCQLRSHQLHMYVLTNHKKSTISTHGFTFCNDDRRHPRINTRNSFVYSPAMWDYRYSAIGQLLIEMWAISPSQLACIKIHRMTIVLSTLGWLWILWPHWTAYHPYIGYIQWCEAVLSVVLAIV